MLSFELSGQCKVLCVFHLKFVSNSLDDDDNCAVYSYHKSSIYTYIYPFIALALA